MEDENDYQIHSFTNVWYFLKFWKAKNWKTENWISEGDIFVCATVVYKHIFAFCENFEEAYNLIRILNSDEKSPDDCWDCTESRVEGAWEEEHKKLFEIDKQNNELIYNDLTKQFLQNSFFKLQIKEIERLKAEKIQAIENEKAEFAKYFDDVLDGKICLKKLSESNQAVKQQQQLF